MYLYLRVVKNAGPSSPTDTNKSLALAVVYPPYITTALQNASKFVTSRAACRKCPPQLLGSFSEKATLCFRTLDYRIGRAD